MIDSGRIEAAVAELLAAIGEDTARPGLAATPRRVAEAYADFFSGLGRDPLDPLRDAPEFVAEPGQLGEVVLLRDIAFRSVCEHHLLPFTGVAHVAYLPGERIVGLGRLPEVVEILELAARSCRSGSASRSPTPWRRGSARAACSWCSTPGTRA